MQANRTWRTTGIVAGVFAALAALILWSALRPGLDVTHGVQALAIKALAGDTNAVAALQATGSQAVPDLLRLFEHRDRFWRKQGWALAPRIPRRFRPAFVRRLPPLDAGQFRTAGARGLGLLGSKATEAVPELLSGLHDPEPYIAMEAASALAKIGPASVAGLTKALSDQMTSARHAAAYALGELGPAAETAVPGLIGRLNDPDPQVRSSSNYSLMEIGYPAVAELSNIVDHADANAREAAVREFIRFYRSFRSMVPPLVKMTKAEQPLSRQQAFEALGAMRASDNSAVGALIAGFRDPVLEVRVAALKAFSLIPWRVSSALNDLVNCLHDPSPEVRVWAARLLGTIGPAAKTALPALEGCLQDNEASVQSAARDAIDKIALETAIGVTKPKP